MAPKKSNSLKELLFFNYHTKGFLQEKGSIDFAAFQAHSTYIWANSIYFKAHPKTNLVCLKSIEVGCFFRNIYLVLLMQKTYNKLLQPVFHFFMNLFLDCLVPLPKPTNVSNSLASKLPEQIKLNTYKLFILL